MKHLKDPITPVNKFANTVRLIGIIFMLIAGVCYISYQTNIGDFWDFFRISLVVLCLIGATMTLLGDLLWKILLKHSDVTKRQFFFYDEE